MGRSSQGPTVAKTGSVWTISNAMLILTFDEETLALCARQADGTRWEALPAGEEGLVARVAGGRIATELARAGQRRACEYRTGWCAGVQLVLADFSAEACAIDAQVTLTVALENTGGEFVCEITAQERDAATIEELAWPYGFVLPEGGRDNYTVWPLMHGTLVPSDWPKEISFTGGILHENGLAFSRDLYMPWWGQIQRGRGYMGILETPFDARCVMAHLPGGPTRTRLTWLSSLGRMGYRRVLRYVFFDRADHVTLAKRYRRYAQGIGRWRSLQEKAIGNPRLETMRGGAVYHTGILTHIQPDSTCYKKDDPAANHHWVPFSQRAQEIRQIAARSGLRGELHLDGWGVRGYDNLHPDVLPPSPEAGGWEGMRAVSQACKEVGWLFATHDQYRDFYEDAPSFSYELAAVDQGGSYHEHAIWYGGRQAILCPSQIGGYLRRNLDGLAAGGVELGGTYLDVFTCVSPDQCFNPNHPVSREQCAAHRCEALEECRTRGIVASSEESADFAAAHVDMLHHAPYSDEGAIPCPLFSLVYHDAIVVPWSINGKAWGIPAGDDGLLHGLLNAGIGYIGLAEEEIGRCKTVAALNLRVGWLEMTNHEYLDEGYRRQRTTFAGGTTVEVDFDSGEYRISPAGE